MKILLVVPRYSLENDINYDYILPIGLGYIGSILIKEGYDIECLNLNHFSGYIKDILNKKLDSKKFDFVGVGNNALGYAVTEKILQIAREHSSKPKTILGGPIITSEPELIFESLKPTFGVLGEGEETIVDLLETIEKNKDLKKVKGIIFKENNKIIKTPKRPVIQNLDSIPFPNYEILGINDQLGNISTNFILFTNLSDNTRMYPLLASRSCPFQCTFCYHDGNYRKRSLDNVMEEVDYVVKKYQINMLTIHDECFAIDETRLREFCRRINILRKEISWDLRWSCQLRVEIFNKELLEIMKNSGCEIIGYGLESYSNKVLKSMKKNISPEQINIALKHLFKSKMALQGFFIFGDVAETTKTAEETLDYFENNCIGQVGLGFIQPYPGSEIYKRCLEKGIIKDRLDFIKDLNVWQWFNMTESMSDKEIIDLKKNILEKISKNTKFTKCIKKKKLKNGKYEVHTKCPFCKEKLIYKNCKIDNIFSYGFSLICRNCFLRFFVVSKIQKIAYSNYAKIRSLRDLQLKIKRFLKKKKL
jgi:radical SAM superfamily enzyme YgiQ (UPF0313 family)